MSYQEPAQRVVSVCREAGGEVLKTEGQSAERVEWLWVLDPVLMMRDTHQAS